MSENTEREESALPEKKTRKVNPNGKKRGPKPKPVTKKIRVRNMDEEQPLPSALTYEAPQVVVTEDERCEYVEVTVMEATDEPRECFFNNGVNRPLTFIRGHKVIIPYNYVITMDEVNAIKLLKHEPIDGANFREYYQPLMRFPYMIHRRGLTFKDFLEQMERFKKLPDPWDKTRGNFPSSRQ
jgi:hypothetical protein